MSDFSSGSGVSTSASTIEQLSGHPIYAVYEQLNETQNFHKRIGGGGALV
jgi:hypothetical protein